MSPRMRAFLITALVLAFACQLSAQSNQANTSLQVTVGPEASISIASATQTFTLSGTVFNNYLLSMPFTYKVRTTKSGGSGTVVATFAADFVGDASGSGPLIAGGDLTYTSSSPLTGVTAQSSAIPAVVGGAGTNVLSFGANIRSANDGTAGLIDWVLANKPQYETDSYQASVVLTISAS